MKKFGKIVALCAASLLMFSCTNLLDSESEDRKTDLNYGSLSVGNEESDRKLDVSAIKFAELKISGSGIEKGKEPSATASVENGAANFLEVKSVPVGKNRIITIQAMDSTKAKLGSVTMRNICDINPGVNSAVVNWSTTALGNVFNALDELGYNVALLRSSDIEAINSKIEDANVHASLFDSSKLAHNIIDNNGTSNMTGNYTLSTATAAFTVNLEGEYTVQVCDPLSNVKTLSTQDQSSITGIAPGSWKVYIIQNGKTVRVINAVFESGKTTDLGTIGVISDKIVLHVEKYKTIWAWETVLEENFTGGKWPGVAMEVDVRDNWYTYELPVKATMVIFSNAGAGQTPDLKLPGAGEWWYTGSKWYDSDPIDYENPSISNISCSATGTATGEVTFTISATDNKALSKAKIVIDDKPAEIVAMTGTNDTVSYVWNSALYKNGSHIIKICVVDASGNSTETQEFTLTTSNSNIKPVAVINGSPKVALGTEKKFNGKSSYDPNGEITEYKWTVTGAEIKAGQGTSEVTIQFPLSACEVTVKLQVTDDQGATGSTSKSVACTKLISTDFREESIYFAMTTRFYDGDKSNNVHCWDENPKTPEDDPAWRGDFKGLIEKLDYIKALGFTAVWITPVVENCSGLDYHGYHAMNFTKVDPRYESADTDFQDLIDAVHAKGMKLVLDVVFNHVSNFGEENLCPMFVKDYSADLADINACLKLHPQSQIDDSYWDMKGADQYATRLNLMKNTDYQNHDYKNYFHHFGFGNWDNFSVQFFQMAGDCVELNTENPKVLKYIGDAYSKYIEMGVDAFRIDTGKHLSRLEFNYYLNNRFIETARSCGNDNFYMFTEVCAKSTDVTYRGNVENLSPYFYTWMDEEDYGFTMDDEDQFEGVIIYPESAETEKDEQAVLKNLDYWTRPTVDGGTKTPVNALAVQLQGMATTEVRANRPESDNHELKNNTYRTPDYSKFSGLNVIDFPMHWNFGSAGGAFSVRGGDKYYNDSTWNVVYVDSHDYGPGDQFEQRYQRDAIDWAENADLMFTFRGIPCIYYGSEVQFMKGEIIDKGPVMPLNKTGRAYFGDNIEGSVTATDFGEYTASGKVAETLDHPLAKHFQRLNKIRREIPALQKGQYTTENCGSGMAFKRRYTKNGVDSFALVTISGNTTFTNLPAGTYVDVITGDTKNVAAGGSITTTGCSTQGNMRVYVLNGPGKIGEDTEWLN